MKFFYGYEDNYVDVTNKIAYFIFDYYLYIPTGENTRSLIFGKPFPNKKKDIKIIFYNNDVLKIKEDQAYECFINNDLINYYKNICSYDLKINIKPNIDVDKIQQKMILYKRYDTDSWEEEYPEQILSAAFINKKSKVLELGANIGRNSMVIASLLENNNNLVSLESDFDNYIFLEKNRIVNNFKFNTVNAALSKRRLIQKDWISIPSDVDLPDYKPLINVTLDEIQQKYNIIFDTIVCDCEGAFYYILFDFPDILKNINLIIIENDFLELYQKTYVDYKFKENGFKNIYTLPGGLEKHPCKKNFYEVWKKE